MEDIDFLKTEKKGASRPSGSEVEYTEPEKEGKKKKKEPPKKRAKKEKPPKKEKKEKKGFFSGLFKTKKKEGPAKKEGPEKIQKKIGKEPELLASAKRSGEAGSGEGEPPLPPLEPEEKQALDKLISEGTKPKGASPLISDKPKRTPTTPTTPTTPPELEQTVEKIKNGEIPLEALDVNLIPKEMLRELKPERKLVNLLWIGLAAGIILLVVYAGVGYLQTFYLRQAQVNQEKIEELEDEILSYKPVQDEITAYNRKIEDISQLLETHIYWNVFFLLLEENVLPTVTITNMTGGVTEPFTIAAEAPDYRTVTGQIEAFKRADNFVKDVEVNSATAAPGEDGETGTVTFTATVTVEPGIFMRNMDIDKE